MSFRDLIKQLCIQLDVTWSCHGGWLCCQTRGCCSSRTAWSGARWSDRRGGRAAPSPQPQSLNQSTGGCRYAGPGQWCCHTQTRRNTPDKSNHNMCSKCRVIHNVRPKMRTYHTLTDIGRPYKPPLSSTGMLSSCLAHCLASVM